MKSRLRPTRQLGKLRHIDIYRILHVLVPLHPKPERLPRVLRLLAGSESALSSDTVTISRSRSELHILEVDEWKTEVQFYAFKSDRTPTYDIDRLL